MHCEVEGLAEGSAIICELLSICLFSICKVRAMYDGTIPPLPPFPFQSFVTLREGACFNSFLLLSGLLMSSI